MSEMFWLAGNTEAVFVDEKRTHQTFEAQVFVRGVDSPHWAARLIFKSDEIGTIYINSYEEFDLANLDQAKRHAIRLKTVFDGMLK